MLDRFYTFTKTKGDLHIHTWDFVEKDDDGMWVYYNEYYDKNTKTVPYDDEVEFCRENDVFESRLEVVLSADPNFWVSEVEFDLDE